MFRSTAAIALLSTAAVAQDVRIECPRPTGEGVLCVEVGMTFPLTGSLDEEGLWHSRGSQLWAMEVNKRTVTNTAGDTRIFVSLTGYDDQSNNALAAELYTEMAATMDVFLGPFASSFTKLVADALQPLDKVLVGANAAAESVYTEDTPLMYGLSTTTSKYTTSALEELYSRGARTAAMLRSDNVFTNDVAEGSLATLEDLGFELLGSVQEYDNDRATNETYMLEFMQNIAEVDADVFLSLSQLEEGPLIVSLLNTNTTYEPRAFLLTSAASNQDVVDEIGEDAEHLLGFSQWQPHERYVGEFFGSGDEWALLYEETFEGGDQPGVPSYIAAGASAAGTVLMHAIQNSADLSSANLKAVLDDVDLLTFFGPVRFDTTGRNVAKPMVTTQIIDGLLTVVAPEDQAEADMRYPIGSSDAATVAVTSMSAALVALCAATLY